MQVEVTLLPHQRELLESDSKDVLMLGGIGSAKTFALVQYVMKMVAMYPDANHMICANTYTQLMNATVEACTKFLKEYRIPHRLVKGSTERYLQIYNTKFFLYSLKNYEDIRGIEVGSIAVDELCFAKIEAYKVIKGRLRDKRGPLEFRGFSSPNGFNWTYDTFGSHYGKGQTERKHLIKAKTIDNIFLPDGYYDDLVEEYGGLSNPLAKQELLGEFVNLQAGAIYWGFDRDVHVKPVKPQPGHMIFVGQDFNVDPMCSVYVQKIMDTFYVFGEDALQDSNSYDAADHHVKRLRGKNYTVIPDSTGKARKSSSRHGATDIQIFKDAGITVAATHNPLIRDRQNNVNIKFKQNNIVIDPSCKQLIAELETLSSRDKEGEISHLAPALGYVLWKLAPMKLPKKKSSSTRR